jgi:beta-N-acetylhexosaminidase
MPDYTANMTLEEQIGQLLMVGFPGTTPTPEIIDLIQNHHIGGIIFFSRNIQSPRQVLELTSSLQHIAKEAGHRYPLLIAIDQENGMVQRLGDDDDGVTQFPGNMALGAIGSEQIAYDVAAATGRELVALGINYNLAPVVDVNNNPANPVIGVRSFGENPQQVARLAVATVKGYRSTGIITCLKHFPGHGDTAVDSHLSLPTLPFDMQRLQSLELVPFLGGIEAGADSVMIAHIAFPALTGDAALPATLSPAIVRGLLREQLGFSGVIISDCLEMKAISETVGVGLGAVKALQAGVDLILISHLHPRQRAGINALLTAVQMGEVSQDVVNQAVERVMRLKAQRLSWQNVSDATKSIEVSSEAHRQLRDHAYTLSPTLVKDEANLLPLHTVGADLSCPPLPLHTVGADLSCPPPIYRPVPGFRIEPHEQILIVYPQRESWTQVEDRHYPHEFFVESVQQRHAHTTAMKITPTSTTSTYDAIYQAARTSALIIMVTVNAYLDAQQVEVMRGLLPTRPTGRPVIGIAVYNPYDLPAFPELPTYLVTYECTKPALASAVQVLFGDIMPKGRLPVSLPGLYSLT